MMRAVIGEALGGPELFEMKEIPVPEPVPGTVRIAVDVAGMGYVDALIAAGRYQVQPPPPYVPSIEFSGRIDALGADVRGLSVGDRVAA
ncbi:MAG: alcohol dehydrogenase catalytic domain-containing protein, partial [Pseudomonadales bacterium]|nr:alcohol dehydrogenase catalytic domain-containing protein [Pseudomonadales bacterium]